MGRRRRWKSKGLPAPGPATHDADPVTRSVAICGDLVAVASGRRWRVVDLKQQAELRTDTSHEGPIRGVQFSTDGQFLLTCADDKTARSWSTADWRCLRVLKAAKKASACAFSADGKHLFFSDRFGDVLTAATVPAAAAAAADKLAAAAGKPAAAAPAAAAAEKPAAAAPAAAPAAAAADKPADKPAAAAAAPPAEEPSLLLGHLQAIISSLSTCQSSSGQQLLISTDRDGKVRASVLPKDPTKGSYQIQSYCLGHTNFVTCAAAVPRPAAAAQQQQQQQLVVSGGGDGTVRLWDIDTGKQLAMYVASEQPPPVALHQQQQQDDDNQQQQQQQEDDEQQQQQQQDDDDEQQQQDEDEGGSSSGSESDGEGPEGTTGGETTEGQQDAGGNKKHSKPKRPPIQRQQYAAVLSLAVSPDGTTIAAAVEGQQDIQILRLNSNPLNPHDGPQTLTAGGYTLELQQKLGFKDVCNPAAVTFDGHGRLWVVGGVLRLDTESAHVAVAAKPSKGGEFLDATSDVLPGQLRSYLECRVDEEESEQAAGQQQIGYYHEGFKRKVYQRDENDPKKPRTHLKEAERLKALREAQQRKQQQQQQGQQSDQQAVASDAAAAVQG